MPAGTATWPQPQHVILPGAGYAIAQQCSSEHATCGPHCNMIEPLLELITCDHVPDGGPPPGALLPQQLMLLALVIAHMNPPPQPSCPAPWPYVPPG